MNKTSNSLIRNMRDIQVTSARLTVVNTTDIQSIGMYVTNDNIDSNVIVNESGSDGYIEIPQIYNNMMHPTGKYAIFEGEGILLDGSCKVIEEGNISNQIGYISDKPLIEGDAISAIWNDCEFSWYVKIWGELSVNKLNLIFADGEYASMFDVMIEVDSDTTDLEAEPEVYTYNITDCNSSKYVLENLPDLSNKSFYITIIINNYFPQFNTKVKINQIFFGESLEYKDDEIVSIITDQEIDLENESITSKSISVTVDDIEEEYNIFEPTGALANLNKNSKIILEYGGLLLEENFMYYMKFNEYILDFVKKEPGSEDITIEASGILNSYSKSDKVFDKNFYEKNDITVLNSASEVDTKIDIDEEIKNEAIQMRSQYSESTSYIDGLRKMATAARSNVVETIDNRILIKRFKIDNSVARINLENIIGGLPKITKLEIPKTIEVKSYTPTITSTNQVLFSQDLIWEEGKEYFCDYNVDHSAGPYVGILTYRNLISIAPESTLDISQIISFLDDRAYLIGFSNHYDCKLEITGSVVELTSSSANFLIDENSNTHLTIDNESIEGFEMQSQIAAWIIDNLKKRFEIECEIQDVFTYEIGDTVDIATGVKDIMKPAIITGIHTEYDGTLNFTLKMRCY